jgi:hypothetical protein
MKYTGETIAVLIVALFAVLVFTTVPGSLERAEYRVENAPHIIAHGIDKSSANIMRFCHQL